MTDVELNFPLLEDTNEIDENFLSEVPLSIIENSIENQFDDPLEFRKKDYINDFITKYNYMKENEFDLEANYLDEFHEEFMEFITNIYDEKLGIAFPDILDKGEYDQHELIHNAYIFFIRKIKKNFVTIICNVVDRDKSKLASKLDKKKDITFNTFKEEIGDEEYAAIISNLDTVIRNILNDIKKDYDVDKFFELCDYGEVCAEREAVIDSYNTFDMTGNFIDKYVDMVIYNEFFIIDIETKVRSHILKKFPIRKSDIDVEVKDNDETDKKE